MNWNKIKSLIIILLLTVIVVLSINISITYRQKYYISDKLIEDTVEILEKDNIIISTEIISRKINSPYIYRIKVNTDYKERTSHILVGDSNIEFRTYNMPDGTKYTTDKGDGIFFGSGFEIDFRSYDFSEYEIPDKKSFMDEDMSENSDNKLNNGQIESIISAVSQLIWDYNQTDESGTIASLYNYNINVEYAYYDSIQDCFVAWCVQCVDDIDIYGNEFVCIVKDNKVKAISGNFCIIQPDQRYVSELLNQANILIYEKRFIDEYRNNSWYQQNHSNSDSEIVTISELKLKYCLYSENEGESFFIIPGWFILHLDESYNIYNATNGELYITNLQS